jgi:SAM-dependent methyltransferase
LPLKDIPGPADSCDMSLHGASEAWDWTPPAEISPALREFVSGLPHERGPILEFMVRAAAELPPGSSVLDVGAGDSPYRGLFEHLDYRTSDWENSVHPGARAVDYVGSADDLPVPDGSFEAVILTQVLEHVPNPGDVLSELNRILQPGGRLYMTMPLTWELHELPFDFFRYTAPGLQRLLRDAGFEELEINPRNDCFATIAQLLQNISLTMGRYPDGRDVERAHAAAALSELAEQLLDFSPLDARQILPLGYSVRARRPGGPNDDERPEPNRQAAGIADARRFAVLAFADELLMDPSMLVAYGRRFRGEDDATLVIYAPHVDFAEAEARLVGLAAAAGLNGPDAADLLALPYPGRAPDEAQLAVSVDAVFARRPPTGEFRYAPHFHDAELDALRAVADLAWQTAA